MNQKVALIMLEKLGYKADVANDGREAIRSLAQNHYDIVLMDCRMPEMDGFEATRRIRATPGRGTQVPIIAMTAGAYSKDREACLAAGMTDYLAKPVRELQLKTKLDQWLSGTGRNSASLRRATCCQNQRLLKSAGVRTRPRAVF